jgi:hypothetical protein
VSIPKQCANQSDLLYKIKFLLTNQEDRKKMKAAEEILVRSYLEFGNWVDAYLEAAAR